MLNLITMITDVLRGVFFERADVFAVSLALFTSAFLRRLNEELAVMLVLFALVAGECAALYHRAVQVVQSTLLAAASRGVASQIIYLIARIVDSILHVDSWAVGTIEVSILLCLLFIVGVKVGPAHGPVVLVVRPLANISEGLESEPCNAFDDVFLADFLFALAFVDALPFRRLGGFGPLLLGRLQSCFLGWIIVARFILIDVGVRFDAFDVLAQFVYRLHQYEHTPQQDPASYLLGFLEGS